MTVAVFAACFAAGIITGATEGALFLPRKKLGVIFTVFTDIAIALAAVFLHALIMYFMIDGKFFIYALISEIFGFIVARATIKSAIKAIAVKIKKV